MNVSFSDRLLWANEMLMDTARYVFHTSKYDPEILKKSIFIKLLAVLDLDIFNYMRVGAQVLYYNHPYTFNLIYDETYKRGVYNIDLKTDCPVIWDAGSNIGISILNFKRLYPNASIVGFEPVQDSYDMIKKNISMNHLKDVAVFPFGVFSSSKDDILYLDDDETSVCASIYHPENGHPVKIKLLRISDDINEYIDMFKIDIEESEYELLWDLIRTGKIKYIKNMAVEFHNRINRDSEYHSLMYLLSKLYDTKTVDVNPCGIEVVQFISKKVAA